MLQIKIIIYCNYIIANLKPGISQSMQPKKTQIQDNGKSKTEDKDSEYKCTTCSKSFPKQADLDTHIKIKHDKQDKQKQPTQKVKSNKVQPRNRVLEMQQNEHQDMIYSYLGELGQKNQESSSREDLLLSDENQRNNIQTNYSFNKVVRTPYEKEIIPISLIPNEWIQESPNKQLVKNLVTELTVLYHALEAQKQKWQFRDPMAPQEEAEDQFSLMQIRKLILNYPRRKITLKYPHFSIFLLWVGRICKAMAWEEFFVIISYYLCQYYNQAVEGKPNQKWEKFNTHFQSQSLKPCITKRLSICDEKTVKKFTDYFNKWNVLFELVNDFC